MFYFRMFHQILSSIHNDSNACFIISSQQSKAGSGYDVIANALF